MNINFPTIVRFHLEAHKVAARSCEATTMQETSIVANHRLPLSMVALVALIVGAWSIELRTGLVGFGLMELSERLDGGAPIYPVAVVVFFASLFGGASCESGGVIFFPMMSLAFHVSLETVRDHALLIQLVGGVVVALAMLFAGCRVSPSLNVAICGTVGALCGVIVGLRWVASKLVAEFVVMIFGAMWLAIGFAVFLLSRDLHHIATKSSNAHFWNEDIQGCLVYTFVLLGFVGGLVCSVCGFGVDVVVFLGMTLVFRAGPEVASATAAIVALAAIVGGIVYRSFVQGGLEGDAIDLFMISAPLAVIGTPIGFLLQRRLGSLHRLIGFSLLLLSSVNLILTMVALRPWSSYGIPGCVALAGALLIPGTAFACMKSCGHFSRGSWDGELDQSEITREVGDSEDHVESIEISSIDGYVDGCVEAVESDAEMETPTTRNYEMETVSYVTFLRWLETNGTAAERGMIASLRIRG